MPDPGSFRNDLSLVRRVVKLSAPDRKGFLFAGLLRIVQYATALVIPLLMGLTIQEALLEESRPADERFRLLLTLIAGATAALIGTAVLEYLRSRRHEGLLREMIRNLKGATFGKLLRLNKDFFDRTPRGVIFTRVIYDAEQIPRLYAAWVMSALMRPPAALVLLAILFAHHPLLALATVVPVAAGSLIAALRARTSASMAAGLREPLERHHALADEKLSAVSVIQRHNQELFERQRFDESEKRRGRAYGEFQNAAARYGLVMAVFGALGVLLTFLYGGWLVVTGEMQTGMLVSFSGYALALSPALASFTQIEQNWKSLKMSCERISEIHDSAPEVPERPGAVELKSAQTLDVRNIDFGYAPGVDVLKGASLKASAGDRIGVKGASGSGKSTLAGLLVRLYDVRGGSIEIDGTDIREAALSSLRRRVGLVLQEDVLFAGSGRENILYGSPDAGPEEAAWAADVCGATELLDARLGERGTTLSAGQRQRLCLARAVLRRPEILILDEATNNLDVEMEQKVLRRMFQELRESIILVISHRPSALGLCGRIFEMAEGKVTEPEPILDSPSAVVGE